MRTINLLQNLSKIIEILFAECISDSEYVEFAELLAEDYDPYASYFKGEFCRYNYSTYVCTQPIWAGEDFNPAHWQIINSTLPETLEGTTWQLNETLDTHSIEDGQYDIEGFINTDTSISFGYLEFYVDEEYVDLYIGDAEYPLYDEGNISSPWINYSSYGDGYRVMTIEVGDDVTNENVIRWFVQNATIVTS